MIPRTIKGRMITIRKKVSYLLMAVFLGFAALQAPAQAEKRITVHLDPGTTQIRWNLGATLHRVHGTFNLKSGVLTFDPSTGMAEGEILVDAASGQSGNKSRDKKMQREVLESTTYPQIFFHAMKVSGTLKPGAAEDMTVEGTFNIHGADHPLKLQVHLQQNGHEITATTHFTVPYVAWGMKDPSTMMLHVKKQVEVDVVSRGTIDGLQ